MRARLLASALLLLVVCVAGCATDDEGRGTNLGSSDSRRVEQINSPGTQTR